MKGGNVILPYANLELNLLNIPHYCTRASLFFFSLFWHLRGSFVYSFWLLKSFAFCQSKKLFLTGDSSPTPDAHPSLATPCFHLSQTLDAFCKKLVLHETSRIRLKSNFPKLFSSDLIFQYH